ncbi:MAG: alpha-glucosidase/alpha-galactosidase [Clostridia bacterium]|nr:alpha-glucosidase/alpha-galactosidase [Clostridia bacterium]
MKVTFMGAGSTVFSKNVLGDIMTSNEPELQHSVIALYDIDAERLEESYMMLSTINKNCNEGRADIRKYLGIPQRKAALDGADCVVNAIQVGGYDPCTITDFEIPKKYGLRQTIADTLGIGGIMRALRTMPVLSDFMHDMEEVCPNALFINYTNPMAMLTGFIQRTSPIKSIGLCHSVQGCARELLRQVGMEYNDRYQWKIAGINHQAWLLEICDDKGNDLYPEIKRRSAEITTSAGGDRVRRELMHRVGYYVTESSEHSSEYTPWFIKDRYPELIDRYQIPLDEYPRRCVNQIAEWKKLRDTLVNDASLTHTRSHEYAAKILEAQITNVPFKLGGNVLNNGCIENLPAEACVEIPCYIDASGIQPVKIGRLPTVCAAINMTNINTQLMTIEAGITHKREAVYQAAMLDPHTTSELSIDDIVSMVDDLIEAHGDWLPKFN